MAQQYDDGIQYAPAQQDVGVLDYSFLNYALGQKESQWQQGESQIKSMYSGVLNAPISNPENVEARNQFMQEAGNNLKALSKADISDPRNIQQASKVFAPFWSDEDMLQDMSKTKYLGSQFQEGEAAKGSKDKDTRDSYNSDSITRLQWAQKDLRDAHRGDGSISKVETPQYFSYTDPIAEVAKISKDMGFTGIETQYHNGAYLITTKNGPAAVPALETYVNGILGDKFNHQFETRAYNKHRSDLEAIKQNYPQYNQQQISDQLMVDKYHEHIAKTYDEPTNQLTDYLLKNQNSIDDINAKKVKSSQDEHNLRMFQTNIEQGNDAIKNLQQQKQKELYTKQGQPKTVDEVLSDFKANPEYYYGKIERYNQIHQIAETIAANSSYKEDIDPVWKFSQEENDRKWTQRFEVSKFGYQQRKDAIDQGIELQKIAEKYAEAGLSPNGQPQSPIETSSHDLGRSTTNVEDKGHTSDLLFQDKSFALDDLNKSLFSSGLTNTLLTKLGINPDDAKVFTGYMSRRYTGENYSNDKMTWDPKEAGVYNKVVQILKDKKYINNSGSDAILDGLGKYLLDLQKDGNVIQAPDGSQHPLAELYTQWSHAQQAKLKFDAINKDEQKWVKHILSSSEGIQKYGKLINNQMSGFASEKDMTEWLPTLGVSSFDGQEHKIINKKDLLDAYNNRKLSMSDGLLTINGNRYFINSVNGGDEGFLGGNGDMVHKSDKIISDFENRFGSVDERKKLNTNLYDQVADNIGYYKDQTGQIGRQHSWPVSKAGTEGINEKLISEALNPANINGTMNYENNGKVVPITQQSNIDAIRAYLNSTANIASNKIQAVYNNVTGLHTPSITIQLPSDDALGSMKGNKVVINLSPNAQGDVISQLPHNRGLYIWDRLKNGEAVKSTPWDEQAGFTYNLSLKNPNDKKSYSFERTYKDVNQTTGQDELHKVVEPIDIDAMTPKQIEDIIDQKQQASIQHYQNSRADWNKKHQTK